MADYLTQGNKIIRCKCGSNITIPIRETITKCHHCGNHVVSRFYGAVIDKNGNYVY